MLTAKLLVLHPKYWKKKLIKSAGVPIKKQLPGKFCGFYRPTTPVTNFLPAFTLSKAVGSNITSKNSIYRFSSRRQSFGYPPVDGRTHVLYYIGDNVVIIV